MACSGYRGGDDVRVLFLRVSVRGRPFLRCIVLLLGVVSLGRAGVVSSGYWRLGVCRAWCPHIARNNHGWICVVIIWGVLEKRRATSNNAQGPGTRGHPREGGIKHNNDNLCLKQRPLSCQRGSTDHTVKAPKVEPCTEATKSKSTIAWFHPKNAPRVHITNPGDETVVLGTSETSGCVPPATGCAHGIGS